MDGAEWISMSGTWLSTHFNEVNLFLNEHMDVIAGAISASFLVILSRDLDKLFKDNVKDKMFVVRTSMFILVCGVGYEVATAILTKFLVFLVQHELGPIYILPMLVLCFVLIGLGARSKKYI